MPNETVLANLKRLMAKKRAAVDAVNDMGPNDSNVIEERDATRAVEAAAARALPALISAADAGRLIFNNVIVKVEWDGGFCPICCATKEQGHSVTCWMAYAMGDFRAALVRLEE